MSTILSGLVYVNEVDIWEEYGAFLYESTKGAKANLAAINTPSKVKEHVSVNFREHTGEKHQQKLVVVNEARDVTLTFAIYAPTRAKWMQQYKDFIAFLKSGDTILEGEGDVDDEVVKGNGWLNFEFPSINRTLKMFYQESPKYSPITNLWYEGSQIQAAWFQVKFREPQPTL